jgi:ABC-type bacteriocin/lantibiotic exporter with double-glycine peptidase domain
VVRALVVALVLAVSGFGCSVYQGSAKPADPSELARGGGWTMVPNFPLVRQLGSDDCGSAVLAAVLRYWGHSATPESIEAAIGRNEERLSAGDMAAHAQKLGLRAYVINGTMNDVVYELDRGRPLIVGLGKEVVTGSLVSHYEVVVGYEPKTKRVLLLDPGRGWQIDTFEGFATEWSRSGAVTIVTFLPSEPARAARND